MQPFKEGVDPRTYIRGHRERGPVQFTYTLQDVADLLGVSRRTLRRWQADSADPFDPSDLEDICRAWYERAAHGVER